MNDGEFENDAPSVGEDVVETDDEGAEPESSDASDSSLSESESASESDDDDQAGDGRLSLRITRSWRGDLVDEQ